MEKKVITKFAGVGIVSLVLILVLGFNFFKSSGEVASETEDIKTLTAKKEDIEIGISADGKANFEVLKLRFNTNGILKEILVQEGQQVEAGDVLAKLDSKNLQHQVAQAQANYNSAVAKLNKTKNGPGEEEIKLKEIAVENARNALNNAQESYDFKLSQFEEGKLSEGEVITEKSKLESAKGQLLVVEAQLSQTKKVDDNDIKSAQEVVNQAKAALEIAKNNLDETLLKAPRAGTILSLNGQAGEAIAANSSGTSDFIVIADTDNIKIEANILEDDIESIQIDQEVSISFEAIQEEKFMGKVTSISQTPDVEQSGIVTYKVNILLENSNNRIKNGMTASTSFIIQQVKDVITIPNEAVKRVDGAPSVELTDKEGNSSWQRVKTGLTDGVKVEIIEGLKEGDQVIVRKEV